MALGVRPNHSSEREDDHLKLKYGWHVTICFGAHYVRQATRYNCPSLLQVSMRSGLIRGRRNLPFRHAPRQGGRLDCRGLRLHTSLAHVGRERLQGSPNGNVLEVRQQTHAGRHADGRSKSEIRPHRAMFHLATAHACIIVHVEWVK